MHLYLYIILFKCGSGSGTGIGTGIGNGSSSVARYFFKGRKLQRAINFYFMFECAVSLRWGFGYAIDFYDI